MADNMVKAPANKTVKTRIKEKTKDMTTGNPMKLILSFSFPLLIGNILQQMYNLVDTIIVGKYLGLPALTSVVVTSSITFLIIGFCMGVCSGFAIPIAQQFGAKKYSLMRKYVANSGYLSVIFAAVLTVSTMLLCNVILTLMNTKESIYDNTYSYLIVIFAGIPFTFLYNMVSGILRAMGDSKTPFYFLLLSAVVNIILDLLFIITFKWGVAGAAYATIISQGLSGFLCLIYMKKKFNILKFERNELKFDTGVSKTLIKMGVPMGLQYSITAIGSIMLQTAVNSLDDVYISACSAATKIKQFAMCPYDAFANASATFGGQNLGARKIERINKGLFSSVFVSILYSIVVGFVFIFWGADISTIFVDPKETEVLHYVQQFLTCSSFFYVFLALLNNIRMTIQGLGYSGLSVVAGVSELLARGIMSLFVIPKYGYIAVCFADQAAWIAATICVVIIYSWVMRQIKRKYLPAGE